MSIEQLDLLLCDVYQMDTWFPSRFKWKKDFQKASYSIWAIDELKRYIADRLYPRKSGSIVEFIRYTSEFYHMMDEFVAIRPDNNFMFSVARDMTTDVLDLLRAMK